MASRRIHEDDKGFFFKGERFKFRHSLLATIARREGKVKVTSVSCGQAGALALFEYYGRCFSSISTER